MNKKISIALGAATIVVAGAFIANSVFSGQGATAAATSTVDKSEIETIIYDYLMENPEVILEAVQQLQQREASQEKAKVVAYISENLDRIQGPEGSFVAGNPNGDVTVVEFFDYHCSFCKQNLDSLMKVVKEDGNVRLVLREFPALRGRAPSMEAAMAAVASMEQDKYMPFHLAMMRAKGTLTQDRIEKIAQSVGIDLVALNIRLKEAEVEQIVEDNMAIAHGLGIDGTPSFLIDGTVIVGLRSGDELRSIIAASRDKKNKRS